MTSARSTDEGCCGGVDERILKAAKKASPTQCVDAADATRLDASHSKHVSVNLE